MFRLIMFTLVISHRLIMMIQIFMVAGVRGMKYIISLYGKKFLKINEILLRKQMKVMSL